MSNPMPPTPPSSLSPAGAGVSPKGSDVSPEASSSSQISGKPFKQSSGKSSKGGSVNILLSLGSNLGSKFGGLVELGSSVDTTTKYLRDAVTAGFSSHVTGKLAGVRTPSVFGEFKPSCGVEKETYFESKLVKGVLYHKVLNLEATSIPNAWGPRAGWLFFPKVRGFPSHHTPPA
jgi:hypothetical protein